MRRLQEHVKVNRIEKPDNGNDHRAAAIDLQAEKAARPAAPCATYCYHAVCLYERFLTTLAVVVAIVCT